MTYLRTLLSALVFGAACAVQAKSLVITTTSGTLVYYKITNDEPPRLVIQGDGAFTLNGQEYAFADVKNFYISTEDYSGEEGTADGIVTLDKGKLGMKGELKVYTVDGRLVETQKGSLDMSRLKRGMYVITNGVSTLKIQKQ